MKLRELEKKNHEWHIPGYQYCGPGTRVYTRLSRGDKGINDLDKACKVHDIEYFKFAGDNEGLAAADKRLRQKAHKLGGISSFLVDKVFFFKQLGEKFGLWSPSSFAKRLSKHLTVEEQRTLGNLLYNKYVLGLPFIDIESKYPLSPPKIKQSNLKSSKTKNRN